MNNYLIRSSIDKIELLHKRSLESIQETLKVIKKLQKSNCFEQQYLKFVDDLFSNNLSEKEILKFLNRKYKNKKVSDYIEIRKSPQTAEYEIRQKIPEDTFNLLKGFTDLEKAKYQFDLDIKTPIVSLITFYEGFIRLLIKSDCLDGNFDLIKNEPIYLTQLINLDYNEESVKEYLINSYCDSKLYGDKKRISEVIKTLGIDCNDCKELIEDFNEIYFRRNMYVHSIPKITTDYQGLPNRIKDKWIKDNKLTNSPEYFNHAFTTVKKIILMILIKKCLYRDKNKKDLVNIADLVFGAYYSKKSYTTAGFAYRQLKNLDWVDDIQRYFFFVNYMVCLKYTNKKELEVELQKWKTATVAPIFKLAKQLIENDYSNINYLVKSVLKTDDEYKTLSYEEKHIYLILDYIKNWPLFKDYRETEYYKQLIDDLKSDD